MKILILNWRDIKHPQAGGSELYFHEMAKQWIIQGHSVSWIAGGWEGCEKNIVIDGINVTRVGGKFTVYLFAPFEYLKLKEKPDVIVDVSNGIPYFSPFFSRKRNILHIHHCHKQVWFKEMPFPLALFGRFLESVIVPFTYLNSKVITVSKSSAENIKKDGWFSRLYQTPVIVNPAFDRVKYTSHEKEDRPTILFLNRIKKYKGIKTFIDVAKLLPEYNFWVAGEGDYFDEMKEYSKDMKNLKFFGKVSSEKKSELMQKAWIFANPSFKEGWGIVNIEANWFGTPVVGSNVGGIKDSVIDGKTGLLFEYGNIHDFAVKIKKIIENPSLRNEMEFNAKEWANSFSWDTTSKEYLSQVIK